MTATIAFDGKEYIAVDSLPTVTASQVRKGPRLGTGQQSTCPGQPAQPVEVYRLVGIKPDQAVFSEPEFGLMERWNEDGSMG